MRRTLISMAMALLIGAVAAQTGQVSQHIMTLRDAGMHPMPVQLFTGLPKSASTDALWQQACAQATVLRLDRPNTGVLLLGEPAFIAVELPFETGTITMDLERTTITTDDFSVVQASTGSAVEHDPGVHYRGMVRGEPGSVVAISVFAGEVMGLLGRADGDLVLAKVEGSTDGTHLLYRAADLLGEMPSGCDTQDDGRPYTKDQLRPGAPKTLKCVRLYWEVNYDIYQGKGSVANATNYVTGLFNQSATLYSNDGITVTLSQVFVWDVPSPYTSGSTSTLLTQFGDYRTSFNGDLAHLLGYAGGGGIAWLNGLCNSQARYKMAYSGISSSYQNVPTYSWSVEVVTHEQGHLMGSKHTHACAWNGNNTAIDGCGPAAGYTEGTCPQGPLPPSNVGGTIMSYCHLTSSTIKFANGFGPQPKTLIVNNVNNASCLTTCGGGTCGTPSGLSAGSITSTSALLTWSAVSGANTYTLQWKPTSGSTFTSVTGLTTTSYSLTGLAAGTSYDCQVQAVCTSGSSTYSGITSFTTTTAACADNYEPNGTNATAASIAANSTINGIISTSSDADWFKFSNTTSQRNIKVTLSNLPANYNLRLYRSSTLLATSTNGGTANEQIIYNTSTVSSNYKVRVMGSGGAYNPTQCYTLNVQISSSPFSTMGMDGDDEAVAITDAEEVRIFPNPASGRVNIVLPPSEEMAVVDILDGTGRLVSSFGSGGANAVTSIEFDMSDKPEGLYLVRVTCEGESTVQRLVIAR